MPIEKELLDQLLEGRDPKALFAHDGLLDELKKALAERVLNAEMDRHLAGEPRVDPGGGGKANHRNGYSRKKVLTGTSELDPAIPCDRDGSFDP